MLYTFPLASDEPQPTSSSRIICIEGPSAAGKTTLAAELARAAGAMVVPELDAAEAPPVPESTPWFVQRSAAQWGRARALAARASLVVLDGDPFKGLWYNWVYAAEGWPGVDVLAPLYRAQLARSTLAFPDLYVVLGATESQLRERRAGDPARTRRNFEQHLRLVAPQRRYFAALAAVDPVRVLPLDTSAPDTMVGTVLAALGRLPAGPPDSDRLLHHMTTWVGTHTPAGQSS